MSLEYKKAESTIYPELIDTTSSNTTVYLRKNVVKKQVKDEETGETCTRYEYDEAKLTKEQYEEYLKHPELLTMEELGNEVASLRKENGELQEKVELLTGCVLEMSEFLYV